MPAYIEKERALEIVTKVRTIFESEMESATDILKTANFCGGVSASMAIEDSMSDIPAAEVAPVVHAKWEHTHTSESYFNECWRCSACGFDDTEGFVFEFCPHCGAKMDLEE